MIGRHIGGDGGLGREGGRPVVVGGRVFIRARVVVMGVLMTWWRGWRGTVVWDGGWDLRRESEVSSG